MRNSTGKYSKQLSDFFKKSGNIVLVTHHNPDGDAIGSMLALYRYLADKGKHVSMVSPNSMESFLMWMNDVDSVIIAEKEKERLADAFRRAELIVILDLNQTDRTGIVKDYIEESSAPRILIDHHPGPDIKADLLISEPQFSSTAELVFALVNEMENNPYRNKSFLEAIYVGMITDTGNFRFGSYNGDTLREVAKILDSGIDKDRIISLIYDNFPLKRLKFKGFAIYERMEYMEEYSSAYIYLDQNDLERFDYCQGDTEGFVNIPLSVNNVIVSALFIEKDDHIKVSLRSKGDFSVNEMAVAHFNGGGHHNAAGGRYYGTLRECCSHFRNVIQNYIDLKK
ncbi:MAG: bifunctional oligoribonuclease/PAP phosphatase NrnA [Bacteroidales bacterium]|nr:bifunctional oligoribonuclease/PAP phosphatase NrnA [Bacteroidales bacterium]